METCARCGHARKEHALFMVMLIGLQRMECRSCDCPGFVAGDE